MCVCVCVCVTPSNVYAPSSHPLSPCRWPSPWRQAPCQTRGVTKASSRTTLFTSMGFTSAEARTRRSWSRHGTRGRGTQATTARTTDQTCSDATRSEILQAYTFMHALLFSSFIHRVPLLHTSQLFVVFAFHNGGKDFEGFKFKTLREAKAVLLQVVAALATAEQVRACSHTFTRIHTYIHTHTHTHTRTHTHTHILILSLLSTGIWV